ncbi:MAG: ABC transporter permease, partial [Propionibacteriales bacterium]|nr:ABC transporter permease [Propionibacteriales bacterium]
MSWLRHGGIAAFIVRRLLLGLLVLFFVSVLVFVATQALGDPVRAILGRDATPDKVAALHKTLRLDQSVLGQYFSWAGGLLHGDLGNSLAAQEPVTQLLGDRLVNSTVLVFCAAVVSIPLSIALGSWAALKREKT